MSDVFEAASCNDRRATLEACALTLAEAIDNGAGPQHLPNLVRQLVAVLAEIDGLPNVMEVSSADEIAARRTARRGANASHSSRAERSS